MISRSLGYEALVPGPESGFDDDEPVDLRVRCDGVEERVPGGSG